MATPILNGLILKAARMMQEPRTSAAASDDTGKVYKSARWTDYANSSLRDLLKEKVKELGVDSFMTSFPEYVKTSGVLTLVAGEVAKPSDAMIIVDVLKSDLTVKFERVNAEEVASVQSGEHGLYAPTASRPVFWEENGFIHTLGQTTGDIVAKYIVSPPDAAVITTAAGVGKKNTANGQYTAATALLAATMNVSFASGDENRPVMFWDNAAGKVYAGTISSVKDADEVYLTGDGLPPANIAAGNVTIVLMAELTGSDIALNPVWHGELLQRMVAYAMADYENNRLK